LALGGCGFGGEALLFAAAVDLDLEAAAFDVEGGVLDDGEVVEGGLAVGLAPVGRDVR